MTLAFILALLLAAVVLGFVLRPRPQRSYTAPRPKITVTLTCTVCGTQRTDEIEGSELTNRVYATPATEIYPPASDGFTRCRHVGHAWGSPVKREA